MIVLFTSQYGEDACLIGAIEPPATLTDDIHDHLEDLWADWREEVPEPDTDSDFVAWLGTKGWLVADAPDTHTFKV